jgi:hypothetical protein
MHLPSTDVLCVYLEPLVAAARVVVIGDATCAARLQQLGARSVHVFDPDEARAARTTPPRGIVVQPLPPHDFDVRDGAFDVGLVPNLSDLPDPAATLARLRRVLGHEGVLLVCASNPEVTGEGIGYYDLYERVALQFANVRMIGVLPFAATTLAELGTQEEEPDVSVDTQLVSEPAAPFAFCALASQSEKARLAPYAIIQQPEFFPTAPAVDDRSEHIAEIEARLSEASARASELQAALADTSEKLDEALRAVAERDRLRARVADLERALDQARSAIDERVLAAEKRAQASVAEEIAALEAQLCERGHAVSELEKEVRRRETIVRELVMALEQSADEAAKTKLDQLALELARKQSELEATRWRVAELEQRLAARPEGDLAEQVDALRQALAQEHEARRRAESGEELARARSELQKQAVLLSQLRETEG